MSGAALRDETAAPSSLRRAVVALAVGAIAGALVALVVPRDRGVGGLSREEGLAAASPPAGAGG